MVLKVYLSRCSGNMKIKAKQDFILRTLNSRRIAFEEVDISDPLQEDEKMYMREKSLAEDGQNVPMPPQIFNDDNYCGDYDGFLDANEVDDLSHFLKIEPDVKVSVASVSLAKPPRTQAADSDDGYDGGAAAAGQNDARSSDSGLEDDEGQRDEPAYVNVEPGWARAAPPQEGRGDGADGGADADKDDDKDDDKDSLHDYENVVLTRDSDGNTVVQLREENAPAGGDAIADATAAAAADDQEQDQHQAAPVGTAEVTAGGI